MSVRASLESIFSHLFQEPGPEEGEAEDQAAAPPPDEAEAAAAAAEAEAAAPEAAAAAAAAEAEAEAEAEAPRCQSCAVLTDADLKAQIVDAVRHTLHGCRSGGLRALRQGFSGEDRRLEGAAAEEGQLDGRDANCHDFAWSLQALSDPHQATYCALTFHCCVLLPFYSRHAPPHALAWLPAALLALRCGAAAAWARAGCACRGAGALLPLP